jgi:hypothetical protein
MSAFVHIQHSAQSLVVPRLAVLDVGRQQPAVFVERQSHVYVRRVHVASRTAETISVDQGLTPGDDVVLVGLYALQDGQKVRVAGIETSLSGAARGAQLAGEISRDV